MCGWLLSMAHLLSRSCRLVGRGFRRGGRLPAGSSEALGTRSGEGCGGEFDDQGDAGGSKQDGS